MSHIEKIGPAITAESLRAFALATKKKLRNGDGNQDAVREYRRHALRQRRDQLRLGDDVGDEKLMRCRERHAAAQAARSQNLIDHPR